MEHLKNTTSKVVKKENSTKKVLNRMEGITLVALVITVIVMLILAGVSISALMGNEGLFARTASAADAYKQASEKENSDIESLLNELDEALKGLEKTEPKPITELATNGTLKVGDYIDYDAGVWKQADLDKITSSEYSPTLHETVYDAVNGNQALPDDPGQFGGFELGQSRNDNSTPSNEENSPRTSGWRIWDIDENTGEVTIIHAGHTENFYIYYSINHDYGYDAEKIFRKRDCSMYENSYAKEDSAHFLKGWEAAEWYNKNCLTEEEREAGLKYELESRFEDLDGDGNERERSFENLSEFVTAEEMPVIEVLEIGSDYWLASSYTVEALYCVSGRSIYYEPGGHFDDCIYGLRPLVTLKSDFKLELDTNKAKDGWNLWKIVEN